MRISPAQVKTLSNQLTEAGLSWKGYMGDMGNDPGRESSTCGHPPLNAPDQTERAEAPSTAVPQGDMYATRHDPFMYFHSIMSMAGQAIMKEYQWSNVQLGWVFSAFVVGYALSQAPIGR